MDCIDLKYDNNFFYLNGSKIKKIIKNNNDLYYLILTGILIFINWSVWIYAVSSNQIVDASFGYFIMPIISVLFGYLFFNEMLNKLRIFSIFLFFSVLYLFYFYKIFPWIGLTVGFLGHFIMFLEKK